MSGGLKAKPRPAPLDDAETDALATWIDRGASGQPPIDDARRLASEVVRLSGDRLAWYAEAQHALLLLERLAEDFFTDQAAFDAWCNRQDALTARPSHD